LVKELTHRLGGQIEATSVLGLGSTFTIRIPDRAGSSGSVISMAPT
jgi:signal transduction histidine kinase